MTAKIPPCQTIRMNRFQDYQPSTALRDAISAFREARAARQSAEGGEQHAGGQDQGAAERKNAPCMGSAPRKQIGE